MPDAQKSKRAKILCIDVRSPYIGKITPPFHAPSCDRPAHYEWQGKLFDVHGRHIEPGVPLPREEIDAESGVAMEMASHDDEIVPAPQILPQIRDMPMSRLRTLAGRLLGGEDALHRTRQQIEAQLRELVARTKERKHPSSTRLARARAAHEEQPDPFVGQGDTPTERMEVEDHPDA